MTAALSYVQPDWKRDAVDSPLGTLRAHQQQLIIGREYQPLSQKLKRNSSKSTPPAEVFFKLQTQSGKRLPPRRLASTSVGKWMIAEETMLLEPDSLPATSPD